ncbi:MAG: transglutaminase-like domain-containing protein [Blautia sp.]|nr:transglutaminase-like domain-containing protein [Blautia sp.]MDY3997935.1 transglutaminase-like domain-containing protein [Blautia sp.]
MKKHPFFRPLFLFIFFLFFLTGCGSKKTSSDEPPVYVPLQVLVPSADGKEVLGNPPLTLDISNKEQGYMIAQANESASSINIQMTGPDGILYTYFVSEGTDAVIPFTGGEGSYQILCYQQVSGNKYAALCSHTLEVSLENPFLPYLYPNQYVDFTPESEACLLAQSMLPDDASDLDGLDAVYNYVISNITYDEEKAQNIEAGYLPDIDETLSSGTGICFDYAALMTAMLRARDIPCKLQIGYTSDIKHAWIDVYIRSRGWVNHAISFDGESWNRMDPTFDSNADDQKEIQVYIGDGNNYTVQFTR